MITVISEIIISDSAQRTLFALQATEGWEPPEHSNLYF